MKSTAPRSRIKSLITTVTLIFALISISFIASGCGLANDNASAKLAGGIDYSKPSRWLFLPSSTEKPVDVFYLYPTSFQKLNTAEANICEIDNAVMLKNSKLAFERQARAFETAGNIYAPYYRQADLAYCLSLPIDEQNVITGGIPKSDVFAAFDYYIKNCNNRRPFILAGHSQGSNILTYLLSEYMKDHPDVYSRMIAAYVIGYCVTDSYLAKNPNLKFAEGPDDTGVIISYNTEAPEISGTNPVVLPGAIAINPISWTRDETLATAAENLGSVTLNADGTIASTDVENYADARVNKNRGVVICSTADVNKLSPGNKIFGRGVFHSFDYPFYYNNIRENAARRTQTAITKFLRDQTMGDYQNPNLDKAKEKIVQYRESGDWARDLDTAGNKGVALLRSAYNQNETQAVVFDIDETALDNYEYFKQNNFVDVQQLYIEWISSGKAPAVTGAKKIYDEAAGKGIHVFFICARDESLRAVTANNLKNAGYLKYDNLILLEDSAMTSLEFKSAARAGIEKDGYRIILNVGDQDSDLDGGHSLYTLKLPNPMY